MSTQNQPQSNIEANKAAAKEQESNLSPTAQLVNRVVTDYIMPVLRMEGLVVKANEIIKAKLTPDDPKVVEFSIACRAKQSEIHEKAKREGRNEKELAVITNYFAKMIQSVKTSSLINPEISPEAPKASV